MSRTQVAWRFGFADAMLGHAPTVCRDCDVEAEYVEAYNNGRESAIGLGLFGTAQANRPSVALRAAILRQELAA